MFMIRYSSRSLGQKTKEVHVPECLEVEHRHWVKSGNNDCELRYFIQPITNAHLVLFLQAKQGDILDSLAPGEVTEVQVAAKCASNSAAGHWSRWSEPARAAVPRSSGTMKNHEDKGRSVTQQLITVPSKGVWFVVQVIFHWRASHLTYTTSPACGTEPGTGQRMTTRFSPSRAWGLWFITKILTKWDNAP